MTQEDFEAKLDKLISVTERVGTYVETLSNQHRDIIRWLLMVVCAIALGSKLLEAAQKFWGH